MMDGISARDTWNLSNRIHCESRAARARRARPGWAHARLTRPRLARAGAADIDTLTNEQ